MNSDEIRTDPDKSWLTLEELVGYGEDTEPVEEEVVEVGYAQIHDSGSDSDNGSDGLIPADDDDEDRRRRRSRDSGIIPSENGAHVIHINGMEIHVYGHLEGMEETLKYYNDQQTRDHNHGQHTLDHNNLQTLNQRFEQTLNLNNGDVAGGYGDGEEEEEGQRGRGRERVSDGRHAIEEEVHHSLLWTAPLPAARCETIKNAMQHISLGGFRPDWADHIPEDQWISSLRSRRNLSSQ